MASCFESGLFRRVGFFQAPSLTRAHKIIGTASVLGCLFTVAHPLTVLVTLLYDGADWGATAWTMDVLGYLAGVGFAFLCRKVSNEEKVEVQQDAFWISVWSAITLCVRVLDILMLTRAITVEALYHTPSGPTLYANIVSEIVIAFPYTAPALVGSLLIKLQPCFKAPQMCPHHLLHLECWFWEIESSASRHCALSALVVSILM